MTTRVCTAGVHLLLLLLLPLLPLVIDLREPGKLATFCRHFCVHFSINTCVLECRKICLHMIAICVCTRTGGAAATSGAALIEGIEKTGGGNADLGRG